ncbi:ribonucleoside-triphosphate reductase [Candidatus Campbellbacteria bacterium RIFCSPLOWO2_01_FULL_34_15]|uniref:ribonucleoside-triphosphate reductase (thioredoxin) n=2 Tax=Candidatus Campbelliibacteriota TaxID=1752727 RepID=A0A1F5ENT2_9BACT|nr:MAG: ribonucleoside-triphosphate reductase [Candidatus Campbellbacteria bacterium RIFCSPLOWO2_01_FULL_34_15]OGD69372.1 MAG: ribonucleoside-triphosphate reductase [Candidatus Campbellbacteria bacterium RIFCSPHIGHO2_01_FULL_34_10]
MVKKAQKVGKTSNFIRKVQKRDGTIVPFNEEKIVNAVYKAMLITKEGSEKDARYIAHKVYVDLLKIAKLHKTFIPTIEGIQDSVESELILGDYVKTAKAYILYRREREKLRQQGVKVPEKVKILTEESKKYFKNPLAEFVYYRSYSKWIEEEGRRETWVETVDRYMGFMQKNLGNSLKPAEYKKIKEFILSQKTMPSMRLMWSAGNAAEKSNVTGYNCSFIAPSKPEDFGEIMYLSMCGAGVGFSAESHSVQKFPQIQKQTGKKRPSYLVPDSKEGWADAFVLAVKTWMAGEDIDFDYSQVRPKGAKLKTMGGKSSGPEPLMELMGFAKEKILRKQGRRLSNLDVHDIVCKIGEIVVSGGVRRTALISLSDLDDKDMRSAKFGQFYITEPQRSMANNSAIYNEKPTNVEFMDEWIALMKSGSGERGIFNRGSLKNQMPDRRWKVFEKDLDSCGTNPCGEIVLKSKQFCNLSEIVARAEDTEAILMEKARIAAILGTYQSTLTNFGYLSKEWKKNCEDERLLGVSITGQWDCKILKDNAKLLQKLKNEVIKTNKDYAKRFKINQSTCTTCVKPSGTVSQLVDASSGMHPRHSEYYIRRVRISATDSLFKMLKDQGVLYHPEVGQSYENANTYVLEFPVKAPAKSVFKNDLTAIEQLEHWKLVKTNYTEHNPSVTISVGEGEWIEVGNWVYSNWDIVGGLSFLPRSNHVYKLAPYEEIDKKKYDEMLKRFKNIDFSKIVTYERADETEGAKELACMGGVCEL